MGSTTSNIANETAKALISVSNTASQNCKFSVNELQSATVKLGTNTNINIYLDWAQYIVLQDSCYQESSIQNQINQEITQEANQIAKSIAQQFSLSSATASNVVTIVAEMSVAISNSFIQNCATFEDQTQIVVIEGGVNNVANIYSNWQQYNNSVLNCVQKDAAVNSAQQKLQQAVKQEADATVENFLAGIIGAIVAVFAVIGIIFFIAIYFLRGSGTNTDTKTIEQTIAANPELLA